ncbi:MAG TPA: fibronectin type III domain-containing protein, partial [Anaerolineae bacterium]|nr:fibronectin type III domain-containing protein [Anaerolineae bacterium]
CAALHGYTFPYEDDYTPAYNPLVDIYKNPHFGAKTVLTIGDGLYGSIGSQDSIPERWGTFNNASPCSLYFSQDPVAIDSVMYDFLEAEAGVQAHGDDYLALAATAGLGVFEHRTPGAASPDDWYDQIDYVYVDVDSFVKLRGLCRDGTARLYWNKPLHPDLAGYHVCYSYETGGADVDQGPSPIDVSNPDLLTYQLTGLSTYSLYDAWIEPYDGNGDLLGESNRVPLMASDIVYNIPLATAG